MLHYTQSIAIALLLVFTGSIVYGGEPGKLKPISEQELKSFATYFSDCIRKKDYESIIGSIDNVILVDSIIVSLNGPTQKLDTLRLSLLDKFESPEKNQLCGLARKQKDLRINGINIRDRTIDLRFLLETGPVYFKLLVLKNDAGELKIIDFKNELTGEYHSQIYRSGLLSQASKLELTLTEKGSKQDRTVVQHGAAFAQLQVAFGTQDHPTIIEAYEALPKELHGIKLLQSFYLISLSKSGMLEKYSQAAAKFRKDFPDDTSILHFDIDAAYAQKDYPKFLELLEKLETLTSNDPLLLDRKVDGYVGLQEYSKAMQTINQAIKLLPDVEGLYFTRVVVASNTTEYQIMLDDLRKLSKEYGYDLEESVDTNPVYKGFRSSKQYVEWKAFLKPKN